MMKRFNFLVLITLLCSTFACAQSTTQLSRKCTGASPLVARAKVEVEKDGDINIQPCSGRSVTGIPAAAVTSYVSTNTDYLNAAFLTNTPLNVTVVSGGIYEIRLVVFQSGGTEALKVDLGGGTATITSMRARCHVHDAENILSGETAQIISLTNVCQSGLVAGIAGGITWIEGTVRINTGGTIIVRAGQINANLDPTTLLAGSYLVLTKLN